MAIEQIKFEKDAENKILEYINGKYGTEFTFIEVAEFDYDGDSWEFWCGPFLDDTMGRQVDIENSEIEKLNLF